MSKQARRAAALTALVLLSSAVLASAAALKGRTYRGALVRDHDEISLKVSPNGRSVLVNIPFAPLYCAAGGTAERRSTHAVAIARNGTFSGSIDYEFAQSHSKTARLVFSGRFSGAGVTGVARSEFLLAALKTCAGSTSFTAHAKKK